VHVVPEELHVPETVPPAAVPVHGPTVLELKLSESPETWPLKELPSLQAMVNEQLVCVRLPLQPRIIRSRAAVIEACCVVR
jgi:hypothetical protein